MIEHPKRHGRIFGTTTIGEKGQIVVPAEAREAMNLKKGDKLLAFGLGQDMLALVKLSDMERFASLLTGRLEAIRKAVSQARKD